MGCYHSIPFLTVYKEMRRKLEIMQSAQLEDSGLGRTTDGSGYEEMALREIPPHPESDSAYLETDPTYPEMGAKNATVGEKEMQGGEMMGKGHDGYDKQVEVVSSSEEGGEPLSPIKEEGEGEGEGEEGSRPASPAPY